MNAHVVPFHNRPPPLPSISLKKYILKAIDIFDEEISRNVATLIQSSRITRVK
jgi:hypothetical protein